MKITYLLTQSLESPSGLGRYWPLAREMVNSGNEVEILALHPNFAALDERETTKDGVRIRYLSQMHVRKAGSDKSYFTSTQLARIVAEATWKMTRTALNSSSQIIHICKPHPMNSMAGLASKYLKKTKLLLDCDDFESASGHFQNYFQKQGVAFFERRVPRKVAAVTTNTKFMEDRLISWGIPECCIYYIPNGVDRKRFQSFDPEDLDPLREQHNLHGKEVIAYIGSLSLASHAVNILIEAFPRIKQSRPNAVLMIVGGGEDYQKLVEISQMSGFNADIRFIGRVNPGEVSRYYALSEVSVDPVLDDDASRGRCPLKLFESWACGIPFVSAHVGDRKQLIGDPPAGLLAKPGDPDSLADEIIRVLSDRDLAKQLAHQGRLKVENYYWDTLTPKMEALYRATIKNRLSQEAIR